MRRRSTHAYSPPAATRPLVAVLADVSSGYGRGVVRGAMRYANIRRRWMIYEEWRLHEAPDAGWPAFDGAIVAGAPQKFYQDVAKTSRNIVVCSGSADPNLFPVCSLDDYAVGAMAAEHLLSCSLTRFAFYGRSEMATSSNRYRGFHETVTRKGFTCDDVGVGWLSPGAFLKHGTFENLIAWLKAVPKPIGVCAVDDSAAHELASACLEAGVAVPDQMAIVGVNNDDLLCESTWPPVSSVDGDYSRVGYAAAAMLDRLMLGEKLSKQERAVRLPPLRVVRRQSTDMLAINDPTVAEAVHYIREHACDPCNVSDVLRHVPVTRRWLERQFSQLVGRGIYDEILRMRIEVAKRLLLQPELTLEQISKKCGFSAIQQFRRAFNHATQSSPGVFRRERIAAYRK